MSIIIVRYICLRWKTLQQFSIEISSHLQLAVKDKWFSLAFDCFHLNLFVQSFFYTHMKKRENSSNFNVSCLWNFILDWFSFTDPKSIHLLKVLWSRCVANDKKVHRGHKQMQQYINSFMEGSTFKQPWNYFRLWLLFCQSAMYLPTYTTWQWQLLSWFFKSHSNKLKMEIRYILLQGAMYMY